MKQGYRENSNIIKFKNWYPHKNKTKLTKLCKTVIDVDKSMCPLGYD
jgi:hypothetical protein